MSKLSWFPFRRVEKEQVISLSDENVRAVAIRRRYRPTEMSLIGMGKRWWSSTEDSRTFYKISHLDMHVGIDDLKVHTQDLKLLRILFVEQLLIRSISSLRYTE